MNSLRTLMSQDMKLNHSEILWQNSLNKRKRENDNPELSFLRLWSCLLIHGMHVLFDSSYMSSIKMTSCEIHNKMVRASSSFYLHTLTTMRIILSLSSIIWHTKCAIIRLYFYTYIWNSYAITLTYKQIH